MDQKSWPWKKKSTEVSSRAERVNSSLSRNEEVNEVCFQLLMNLILASPLIYSTFDLKCSPETYSFTACV